MFDISIQQKDYQTYILADQKAKSVVEVVPQRGGIITTWRYQNQDILYLDAQRFANPQLSIRGGIPILFPICGNLPDNSYKYQGQKYQLKQHGFARDLPWQVTAQDTQNHASITLVLNSNAQTLAVYPFDFQLTFTYQLQSNSLKIQQRYTNNSAVVMPFSTGLHPYFFTGDKNQLSFDIPCSQQLDQISQQTSPFSGNFDFSREEIDLALLNPTKNSASIQDQHSKRQITLNYSEIYSTLVFWTVQDKDYVCLEPWSAKRNALNTGENLLNLEPGSSCEAWVEIVVDSL